MSKGPLFWCPTVEGLYNYEYVRDNPEQLDNVSWHRGCRIPLSRIYKIVSFIQTVYLIFS